MTGKTLNTDTAVAADAERDTEMTEKITREEIELILQAADTHIKAGWPRSTIDPVTVSALCTLALQAEAMQPSDFQNGVDKWMDACFGPVIKADQLERADRFIEEALELTQTMPGFNADRAHALVDYVFSRDVGEQPQEVGGVMVTLAALCNTIGINIDEAADRELARVWTKVEKIRAKQAAKPTGSALPVSLTSLSEPRR